MATSGVGSDGAGDPFDIDVKKLIQTALQVEDESNRIKQKNGLKVPNHSILSAKLPI
jgi:hypothetical protein